jgi:NAD(P)-dependent dehydrogenase (short-subunit alcohol dehydrogenase family)
MKSIEQMMSLKGRRSLVTGATGNLGKVFADSLAQIGSNLILLDRPGSNIDDLADALSQKYDVEVVGLICDQEDQISRVEVVRKLKRDYKSLNIIINNAAFTGSSNLTGWNEDFENQSIETWRRAIEVNLTSVFELSQGLFPLLKNSVGANIINIGSIYGTHAPSWAMYKDTEMNNPAAYGASKAGLIHLTRWLSSTLAPDVRVNSISPGGIFRNQPDSFVKSYESRTPLKRMATEDDIRGALVFLASDLSRYVTGQNLIVDGGWTV